MILSTSPRYCFALCLVLCQINAQGSGHVIARAMSSLFFFVLANSFGTFMMPCLVLKGKLPSAFNHSYKIVKTLMGLDGHDISLELVSKQGSDATSYLKERRLKA